jgi:signal transduction histidine kinase
MRIAQRLFLAVIPAIVGLFTVAALAYWGHMYRAAPGWVIVVAAVAAVGSLAVAWRNTQYIARRIERLAGPDDGQQGRRSSPLRVVRDAALPQLDESGDEIDSIEGVVHQLNSAVTVAEADRRRDQAAASERVQEYAALLAEAASAVTRQLEEVRLPIHILLANHFGTLNENQEEMLAAARAAAEAAGVELDRLRDIAGLDRGTLDIRHEQVRLGDLLQGLRPQLQADGERTGVRPIMEIMPGLPRVAGDRARLQQALELLLRHLVRHATPGNTVGIVATSTGEEVVVTVEHGPAPTLDADIALARRIILAHGGSLEHQDGRTWISLRVSGAGTAPLNVSTAYTTPPTRFS